MSDTRPRVDVEKLKELAKLRAVLSLPGMDDVPVRRNVPYRSDAAGALALDVYSPPGDRGRGPFPAVIFVVGYADVALMQLAGFTIKDMACYVSWGQLVALSGITGISYSSAAPLEDADTVLHYVRRHAADLDVDPERIGIWAASGNGPTALSLLMSEQARLRYAVLCNTYMLDLDGSSTVADMSAAIGFAAPTRAKSVENLPARTPIFVVRSGKDEVPGLNGTIDRFVARAIEANRRITFVNLPDAPHSFDTSHDTAESRLTIEQILAFMRSSSSD